MALMARGMQVRVRFRDSDASNCATVDLPGLAATSLGDERGRDRERARERERERVSEEREF